MNESLFIALQHILPKQAMTEFAGWVANGGIGEANTQRVIRWFIKRYNVNMSEAQSANPEAYKTFNDFFTRPLRAGVRPEADSAWICPVDGAISQLGGIRDDAIFQAKGHDYSMLALLGGEKSLASEFVNGSFCTIYLSPRDYHRIHMPVRGSLREMRYVPGKLYSVNPATARNIPGLFAINERLICTFDTEYGPFINVLVGATIVGSMATTWHGPVVPERGDSIRAWHYDSPEIRLEKAQEMGRFMLGSTVVMLWPKNTIQFNPDWQAERSVKLFESMGQITTK